MLEFLSKTLKKQQKRSASYRVISIAGGIDGVQGARQSGATEMPPLKKLVHPLGSRVSNHFMTGGLYLDEQRPSLPILRTRGINVAEN